MSSYINVLANHIFLVAAVSYLLWVLLCWVFIKYFFPLIEKLVSKTATKIDDLIFEGARFPIWIILLIIGFFVVSRTVGLPSEIIPYLKRFAELSVVFILVYFLMRLSLNLFRLAAESNAGLKNLLPTFSRIANVVVWGAGLLMLMDIFGISVTPALASLGIAGLAVGLALQDTLSNFFAGIYILINQPIRVGDYIELENGLKGYVTNVGWRETRIQTLPNNIIIVPNSKLSQSILTNYYLPQTEMACLVDVGVSYDSDLEKVERLTMEVGRQVLEKVSGGIKTFEPFIRYHTFSDFSINFTVILRVAKFVDKYLVTHEFIKALHRRYQEAGIVIPFPIRTVHLKNETS